MKRRRQKPIYTLALVAILSILLVFLAVLQYDWVGQNAEHERQTLQTALHNLAIDFAEKFNREIRRTYSFVEMSGEALQHRQYNELVERQAKWRAEFSYPGLVKNVFLAVADDDDRLTLLLLNKSEGRFEEVEWPSNLGMLRSRFGPEAVRRSTEGADSLRRLVEHGYIAGDVPAVLRFFAAGDRAETERAQRRARLEHSFKNGEIGWAKVERATREMNERTLRVLGFAIIELDPDYIKNVFIPALAEHGGSYRGLEYDIAVLKRGAGVDGIIYQTAGYSLTISSSSDETLSILSTAIDSNTPSEDADWRVLVKHRSGSVEAAVGRLRFKNLAVSFGILFLLAGSVLLILVNSRRAQRLAREQMEFVAGVSHEFRTPLAVIHAISENLADGLITDRQEIERCGMVIRDDVRKLAGMVEEVLQLAGAFRGKSLYHRAPVDLTKLIEQVLGRYPQLSNGSEWLLEKEIEAGLPLVPADSTALASAIGNILDNAIKYSGDVRWIRLKAHASKVSAPCVTISVEDRGRGITREDLPHIFEPFYRGREVRAAQIHGNGLGLSLVKNIVDAHGGTISVESSVGTGSVFVLTLPVGAPAVNPDSNPVITKDRQSPATVG